ncbi:AarF/ABC1/UbiB kinase family protein [Anaerobacillus alkaliphilus]|uniref:AarF/ABC1/UbiB kinase family protein n=1 Tax=Anaerobacillus alkaliphilus TaxID=1548597 RepID=A0A4Q0VNJ9_9BACI|nr:AarF/ABC1/UbiB kinase family protein [Anaerobacillus alkaliphilus]
MFFTFIITRLIGTRVSKTKVFLAIFLGFSLTAVAYFFLFLKDSPELIYEFNPSNGLYILFVIITTMFIILIFEMLSNHSKEESASTMVFSLRKIRNWFKRQRRYLQVLTIAMKNSISTKKTFRNNQESVAISLRKTLEECGGVFIKFGQVLSTRTDLLPLNFIEELSKLQENVKYLTKAEVENVLNTELPGAIENTFKSFDMEPIAAASIGQVHRAILKNSNQQVVVKILRPNVTNNLKIDLDILIRFSNTLSKKSELARNIGMKSLAIGFAEAMLEEIDFRIEARNSIQISEAMKDMKTNVKVPVIYQEISTSKLLVIEYIEGVTVKNGVDILEKLNIDKREFQKEIFDTILQQIFTSGVFHADPHPGNVYILHDGRPALIDFGSVGRLGTIQQAGFKRLMVGLNKKNAYLFMDGLLDLIEPHSNINKYQLEQALSQFLINNTSDAQNTEQIIHDLFGLMNEFELSFYPMVAGAFRSLITLQGTLEIIDDNFDIMIEAKRFAQEHMNIINNNQTLREVAYNEALSIMPILTRIPRKIDDLTTKMENGNLTVRINFFGEKDNVKYVNYIVAQILTLLAGTAFGGISIGLLSVSNQKNHNILHFLDVFAYLGLTLSAIFLIRVMIQALRRSIT